MKIKVLSNLYDFSRKSRLDPYLWTPSKKLKQYIKEALMRVVGDFLSSVELPLSQKDIQDIQLTGSMANYNYSKYSDMDLHILIDFSKLNKNKKFIRDYFLAKKNNWNNKHKITIYGHEVEIYVQDSTESHFSSGVYSIKNNKWIVEPEADEERAHKSHVLCAKRKADDIAYEIDDLVSRADDEDVLEEIEYLKEKIRNMRKAGLERDGEDAVENIAFKILRRRQDLKLLSDLQVGEYDQSVSIQEDQEWWKKRRKEDNLNYRELIGFVKGVKVSKKGGGYKLNPPMKLGVSGPPGAFQEGLLREEIGIGELKRLLDGAVRGDTLEFKNGEKYITQVTDKETGKDKIRIEPQTYEPKLGDGRTVAFKPGIKYTAKALGNGQFEIETNWTPQQGSTDGILYNFQRAPGGICKTIVCGESELTLGGTPYRLDKIMSGAVKIKASPSAAAVSTLPAPAAPVAAANVDLDSIYDAVDTIKVGKNIMIVADLTYGLSKLFGSGLCKKGLRISLKKFKGGFNVRHTHISEDDKIGCFPSLLDEKLLDAIMVKTLITDLYDDKEIVSLTIAGVRFFGGALKLPAPPAPPAKKSPKQKAVAAPTAKWAPAEGQVEIATPYHGVRPSFASKEKKKANERALGDITSIVLHDTLTSNLQGMLGAWKKPKKDADGKYYVGTHFSIDKNGAVRQHLPVEYVANHTKADGWNKKSIGIDIITRAGGVGATHKKWKAPTKKQMKGLYTLIQQLKTKVSSIDDSVYWPSIMQSLGGWDARNKAFYSGEGIASHGHVQANRTDGLFPAYYIKLRIDGDEDDVAYKKATDKEDEASKKRYSKTK